MQCMCLPDQLHHLRLIIQPPVQYLNLVQPQHFTLLDSTFLKLHSNHVCTCVQFVSYITITLLFVLLFHYVLQNWWLTEIVFLNHLDLCFHPSPFALCPAQMHWDRPWPHSPCTRPTSLLCLLCLHNESLTQSLHNFPVPDTTYGDHQSWESRTFSEASPVPSWTSVEFASTSPATFLGPGGTDPTRGSNR